MLLIMDKIIQNTQQYIKKEKQMQINKISKLLFKTSQSKPVQFNNYYLLKLEYGTDGYYETYAHRKVFAEQLKKIQQDQQARVLGGDNFPKKSTTILFNCNHKDIPVNFANKCIYNNKKFITNVVVTQLNKISAEKFEKIWQFYQPKFT